MDRIISPLQRQALNVGAKKHYQFKAVQELDYREGWVYERVSTAPEMASKRIKTLQAAGIRVKEIIVAHEAPRVLPAPKPQPAPRPQPKQDFKITPSIPVDEIAYLFLLLFLPLAALDPACIVVLEDGSMVEVVTWLD